MSLICTCMHVCNCYIRTYIHSYSCYACMYDSMLILSCIVWYQTQLGWYVYTLPGAARPGSSQPQPTLGFTLPSNGHQVPTTLRQGLPISSIFLLTMSSRLRMVLGCELVSYTISMTPCVYCNTRISFHVWSFRF